MDRYVDDLKTEMSSRLTGALETAKGMQSTPTGTVEVRKGERTKLFKRLHALPKEERQVFMEEMADKAGHQHGEAAPCELCRFLAEQMKV